MDSNNNNSRRSSLTADRLVQNALIKRVFLHWCIFVLAVVLLSAVVRLRQPSFAVLTWSEFWCAFAYETVPFLVVVLAFIPTLLVDTRRIGNRFAGPMVRFRRCMREVVQGKRVVPISFRPGDFWQDIATHVNQITKQIDIDKSSEPLDREHGDPSVEEELVGK